MNKTYRSVWNESTGTWIAAQENAKGRGKSRASASVVVKIAFAGGVALSPLASYANGIVVCSPNNTTYGINGTGGMGYNMQCTTGSDVIYMGGAADGVPTDAYADPNDTYLSVNNATTTSSAWTGSTPGQSIKLHAPGSIILDSTTDLNSHKIINLSAGIVSSASMDGVNGSQLYAVSSSVAAALGGGATVAASGAVSNPSYALANANSIDGTSGAATNVGNAFNTVDTALGKLGNNLNNINNGAGIKYFHTNSTLADSSATGTDAVAIGGNASATTANSVALGSNSVANSTTLATAGFNPGGSALSAATAAGGEVSVGAAGKERRITNVAAGLSGTDAVNVSQLQSEDAKVNNEGAATAAALGGGSTYNTTTGAITNPTYSVGGTTVNNVGDAITNIDGRVTQNTTDITNLTNNINNGTVGLVQQNAATRNITVAQGTDGTAVDFTGKAGTRTLTGVSAGAVNATSVDAVNGSQLYATNQNVSNVTNVVNNITNGGAGIKYFHTNSTLADSSATGQNSMAAGPAAVASASNAVAIGYGAQATGTNSISIGTGNIVSGNNSGAFGDPSTITGSNSYSIGNNNTIAANNAFAMGNNISIAAGLNGAVVLGNSSTASAAVATTGTTLGGVSYTFAGGAPAAGDVVSIGSSTAPRQLQNVAAGQISANSTDAVNGSELYATNQAVSSVNNMATYTNRYFKSTGSNDGTDDASALNYGAVAAGPKAYAYGSGDIAIGQGATTATSVANVGPSVAIGENAQATGGFSLAMGTATVASGTSSMALGIDTQATGVYGAAFGYLATASGQQSVAAGYHAQSVGLLSSAYGDRAQALGDRSVAMGTNSLVDAGTNGSVAIGRMSRASVDNSVALGNGSFTDRTNTVSIGADTAYTVNSGIGIYTAPAQTRQLVNMAAGTQDTDAVNVSQLKPVVAALGSGASFNSTTGAVTGPSYVLPNADAITGATGPYATVGGALTDIDNALGVTNTFMTNINNGGGIKYFHANSTLADSSAAGTDSVAAGPAAVASASNAVALGNGASATTLNSVALGAGSIASSTTLTTAGYNPGTSTIAASTAAGGEVSVGSAGAERRITNVAAGLNATDAVNVSQLQSEDAKVNNEGAATAAALGGGSTYNTTTGAITNPTYSVGGTTVNNVGDAITNLDGRVTQNTTDITNLTNNINSGTVGLVQQDAVTRNITVAQGTDGT
ncbi:hypothetical protein JNC05_29820, partial [Paraburkholderia ginsengiterrae]|nr:hypothetical protein [Paraburkholderia ginsengiterrae]